MFACACLLYASVYVRVHGIPQVEGKKEQVLKIKTSCKWNEHHCRHHHHLQLSWMFLFATNLFNDIRSQLHCALIFFWMCKVGNYHMQINSHFYIVQLTGCGFIGRHLVTYFVNNGLVSHIRVVDKAPPLLVFLNNQHMTAFNDKAVEFYSANLINQGKCQSNVYIPFINVGSAFFRIPLQVFTKTDCITI